MFSTKNTVSSRSIAFRPPCEALCLLKKAIFTQNATAYLLCHIESHPGQPGHRSLLGQQALNDYRPCSARSRLGHSCQAWEHATSQAAPPHSQTSPLWAATSPPRVSGEGWHLASKICRVKSLAREKRDNESLQPELSLMRNTRLRGHDYPLKLCQYHGVIVRCLLNTAMSIPVVSLQWLT